MSRAQATLNGKKKSLFTEYVDWAYVRSQAVYESAVPYAVTGYMIARHLGWALLTTAMITMIPLVFEIKREAILEELDKIQITNQIQQGATPQDLIQQGLTAAAEPKVLN